AAVLAALFIREFGGADQAGAGAMILACFAAVVVTGLVGLLNGLFVTRFGIPPFLVTLAAMFIASGFAYRITAGESVYQLPDSFTWLGRGETLPGLPNAVVLMFLLYGLAHLLMT
ncbi:MAG: ABC transporter permease, partial [Verrucomicrobiae bacterium]|nr:ABC transporter permease [Verrucomicrobiae bacterium]